LLKYLLAILIACDASAVMAANWQASDRPSEIRLVQGKSNLFLSCGYPLRLEYYNPDEDCPEEDQSSVAVSAPCTRPNYAGANGIMRLATDSSTYNFDVGPTDASLIPLLANGSIVDHQIIFNALAHTENITLQFSSISVVFNKIKNSEVLEAFFKRCNQ